ncbi:MAG: TetR/AcrR family transcriptional regulator [Mycobacterium sp.]
MSTPSGVSTERRRRPKDRKAQIARVSAEAFSELGYHGVSMEDIAGRVGVSAASLYRHYAGKYDLFQAAVLGLGTQLVDCTAFVDDVGGDTTPEQTWERLVTALIDITLKNRTSGGLYRWEGRYLDRDDQLVLNAQIKLVNRRLQRPMSQLRPELDSRQRWTLSSAVLSVIGSITDHHAQLPTDRMHSTLSRIARQVRDSELPAELTSAGGTPRRAIGAEVGEYERILHASMVLFDARGYRDTGMDDIAAAAEMSTTGLYRYFSGKGAILAALYRRAADRVSGDVSAILATTDNPRDAVEQLTTSYVQRSFADPELACVYYAERVNVPAEDQVALRNIQRATIGAWAGQVAAAVPAMSAGEARFAVHAGFALVVDLTRLLQHVHPEAATAVIRQLFLTALVGV